MTLVASVRGWLEDWSALAEWGVAAGTLLLAVATWLLARQTRDESVAVAQQVALQREQMEADRTPLVYPVSPYNWVLEKERFGRGWKGQFLVMKNGGKGLARNVHGQVSWDDGSGADIWPAVAILNTTIAGGEEQDVRLDSPVANWARAYGTLDYEDIQGQWFRTYFEVNESPNGKISFDLTDIGLRERMGDPPERR